MPGLIDVDTGLKFGDGLVWLLGGIGGDGLDDQPITGNEMVVESPENTPMITEATSQIMLTESAAPSWVLTADGFEAALDIDFTTNQGWLIPAETSISTLLTCTRATPALASYTDSSGVISYFAPNALRYGDAGLLVEESRTNSRKNSQAFGAVTWTPQNTIVSSDVTAAPDGTTTADLVYPNGTGTARRIVGDAAGNYNGSTYTSSVYAKYAGLAYIYLFNQDGSSATWFNIQTGTIGSTAAGATPFIQPLANGWFRCGFSGTSVDTSDFTGYIGIADANGSETATASGTNGVYFWGAQLEIAGSFATSYIPTTTVAVTRAADLVVFSDVSWVTTAQSTWYLSATPLAVSNDGNRFFAAIESGDFSKRLIDVSESTADLRVGVEGGGDTGFLQMDGVLGAKFKLATAIASNDGAASANGGTVVTDNTIGIPAITNPAVMLGGFNSALPLTKSGYYTRFTYWQERISNATLQSLTEL